MFKIFIYFWINFQIEKSPTLGSIDTTDFDKRQFAYQSLEYNLRDKQFCELFPDIVNEIQVSIAIIVGFRNIMLP